MRGRSRLRLCALLSLLPVVPISWRLFSLQVVKHDDLSAKVQNATERAPEEILPRGRILDREGRVLAESLPSWSVYIDVRLCRQSAPEPGELKLLADSLGMPLRELETLLRSTRRTEWLKRKMTYPEVERVKAAEARLHELDKEKKKKVRADWIGVVPDEQRYYPNGPMARSLLGEVNLDGHGTAGLEKVFEADITARSKRLNVTRDGSGRLIMMEPEAKSEPPPDLTLTIDRRIQFLAEQAIEEAVVTRKAKRGVALVQDPKSGDVLAMAAYPPEGDHNAAVQDVYEPGSIFKIVTAVGALENHSLSPGEKIDCEGGRWAVAPTVTIKDHEGLGLATLEEIIEHSSNVGTGKIGLRIGADAYHRMVTAFGFGYRTGLPLPAESPGLVTDPKGWNRVRLANTAFGQGIAVTPMQILCAYSAVANGGLLIEPRLVSQVGGKPQPGPVVVRRVASPETIAKMRSMLELVVEGGTGKSAKVPGYKVAGKTGTAQKVDPATGRYSGSDYVASFAGYAPADEPRYTVLIVVDSPRGGYYAAEVSAPVFSRLTREILALEGVKPDDALPLQTAKSAPAAKSVSSVSSSGPSLPKAAPAAGLLPKPSLSPKQPLSPKPFAPLRPSLSPKPSPIPAGRDQDRRVSTRLPRPSLGPHVPQGRREAEKCPPSLLKLKPDRSPAALPAGRRAQLSGTLSESLDPA